MAKKSKRPTNDKGFPVDDRPVIFNLFEDNDVNFIGKYIEEEGMFLLSLNDTASDFVPQNKVHQWWYVDEHPIVMKEVFSEKSLKKAKKEGKQKHKKRGDSKNQKHSEIPEIFQSSLPPFLGDLVRSIEEQTGVSFPIVNIRVVRIDELDTLNIDVLEQLLEKAVSDENYELATKFRDAIKSKSNEE